MLRLVPLRGLQMLCVDSPMLCVDSPVERSPFPLHFHFESDTVTERLCFSSWCIQLFLWKCPEGWKSMPMSVPHALLINPAQVGDARLLVNICVVTAGSETARPCWVLERIISLGQCLLCYVCISYMSSCRWLYIIITNLQIYNNL